MRTETVAALLARLGFRSGDHDNDVRAALLELLRRRESDSTTKAARPTPGR
jgi:hypothetical protein